MLRNMFQRYTSVEINRTNSDNDSQSPNEIAAADSGLRKFWMVDGGRLLKTVQSK